MASPLDGPMGQLAATLIDKVKLGSRPATLNRPASGGTYDAATDTYSGQTAAQNISCRVVFEEFADAQIDGTLVQAGDRKAIVARQTLGTQPVADSDELTVDGDTWQIVRVLGYSSGESEAAYRLHVRR